MDTDEVADTAEEPRRVRRTVSPEERAAKLRAQAEATERRAMLARLRAHPTAGPCWVAYQALAEQDGAAEVRRALGNHIRECGFRQ